MSKPSKGEAFRMLFLLVLAAAEIEYLESDEGNGSVSVTVYNKLKDIYAELYEEV